MHSRAPVTAEGKSCGNAPRRAFRTAVPRATRALRLLTTPRVSQVCPVSTRNIRRFHGCAGRTSSCGGQPSSEVATPLRRLYLPHRRAGRSYGPTSLPALNLFLCFARARVVRLRGVHPFAPYSLGHARRFASTCCNSVLRYIWQEIPGEPLHPFPPIYLDGMRPI